jgi:hypothetical protein
MLLRTHLGLVAIILAVPLSAASARADTIGLSPIELISSQVTTDPSEKTITFALTFDRVPDLQTYNGYTNAADEFSIDILNHPLKYPVLTGGGGEDVRILSSEYRVADSPINSGRVATPIGYSAITTPRNSGSLLLYLVPFRLVGSTVTVTASYAQLKETNGRFEAALDTYRYGAWSGITDEIGTVHGDPLFTGSSGLASTAAPVPEPASLALLGLGGLAMVIRRKNCQLH